MLRVYTREIINNLSCANSVQENYSVEALEAYVDLLDAYLFHRKQDKPLAQSKGEFYEGEFDRADLITKALGNINAYQKTLNTFHSGDIIKLRDHLHVKVAKRVADPTQHGPLKGSAKKRLPYRPVEMEGCIVLIPAKGAQSHRLRTHIEATGLDFTAIETIELNHEEWLAKSAELNKEREEVAAQT
ncbi:hypothetical protein [Neptuniibacter sp. QD37_11]|uniref:hypothetical protein n=1 Tax=Neptuniibacter sp. QD37_11 TaxID=3398209 RepID=UPI0039F59843